MVVWCSEIIKAVIYAVTIMAESVIKNPASPLHHITVQASEKTEAHHCQEVHSKGVHSETGNLRRKSSVGGGWCPRGCSPTDHSCRGPNTGATAVWRGEGWRWGMGAALGGFLLALFPCSSFLCIPQGGGVMSRTLFPLSSHVEALTLGTAERDCIQSRGLYRGN